jgi:transmembrane 9 superfamily protein 2/4
MDFYLCRTYIVHEQDTYIRSYLSGPRPDEPPPFQGRRPGPFIFATALDHLYRCPGFAAPTAPAGDLYVSRSPSTHFSQTPSPVSTMRRFGMPSSGAVLASLLLALSPLPASAFYFPGVAPTSYKTGDNVPLFVNHLTPADSQDDPKLRSVFSFDYYHSPFHFCRPEGGPQYIRESLGSILFGDRIQTSPFELKMGVNETCKALCAPQTFSQRDAVFVNSRIYQGYDLNWLIDGLPAAQLLKEQDSDELFYSPGFALGSVEADNPQFNNHYDIHIEYHQAGPDQFRVVGVLVDPFSLKGTKYSDGGMAECGISNEPVVLVENVDTEVTFTYSVYWRLSPTPFATRWDKYLHVYDPKIHWFSLINSAVIVTFLIGMVSTILVRTLKKDIARYNRLDQFAMEDFGANESAEDGVQEDSGWKLVHGDVFRPPKNPLFLSVLLGNGVQLFAMAGLTIGMSPGHRQSLSTDMYQRLPSWAFCLQATEELSAPL